MTPRLGRPGRWLRTARHLRPCQLAHAVRHGLNAGPRPASARGLAPRLGSGELPAPFLGAPPHARYDGHRRLRLLEREVAFGDPIDWDHSGEGPLWSFHLHQFDYARAPGLLPGARRALVLDWIARHRDGTGWKPGPISLRVLSWLKLLRTRGALELDPRDQARVLASLADQLATLERNLELRLLGNHYLSNLLALVCAGLALEGSAADAWLGRESELRSQLAQQILPDGAHVERSPMYHALLLEQVLDALNLAGGAPGRAPSPLEEILRDCASRMLGALRVWTHPDGEIALFGDSAFGIAHPPAALHGYARELGVEPRGPARSGVLDAAGYVRLEGGPFTLIASVAGPMPSYQPGHAHCDALSFELSVDGERVVTDTGVAEYIPGPLRETSRATRSHATVELGGEEQAEVWASHRVGGRPEVQLVAVEPGRRAEAICAGWATRDTRHRRVWEVAGAELRMRDSVEGRSRPARYTLPLAPGLEPRLDGNRALLALAGGTLEIGLPEGPRWSRETLSYFPEFGRALERAALVGTSERPAPASWHFRLG